MMCVSKISQPMMEITAINIINEDELSDKDEFENGNDTINSNQ